MVYSYRKRTGDNKGAALWRVLPMSINLSAGFDVFSGSKLLAHFATYEEATAYAAEARCRWVRYWLLKEGE